MIKLILLIFLLPSISFAKDIKFNSLKLFYQKLLLEKEPSSCKKIGKVLKAQSFNQADLDKVREIEKSDIPKIDIFSKKEMAGFIFLFKNWGHNDYSFLAEAFNNPAAHVTDKGNAKPSFEQKKWAKTHCKKLSQLVYDLKTLTFIKYKGEELANMSISKEQFSLNQIIGDCRKKTKELIKQLKFEDICLSIES